MAQLMRNRQVLMLAAVLGVVGALVAGFALGHYYQREVLTPRQTQYIDGVAGGVRFIYTDEDPPTRCVREYYPDDPVALAGCLEAVGAGVWKIP